MKLLPARKYTKFHRFAAEFEPYLRQAGYAARTIEGYIRDVLVLLSYFEDEKPHIDRLDQVTKKDILDYQAKLYYFENEEGKKYSIHAQFAMLCSVKVFFRFLVRKDYLIFNPASDIELPKKPKELPRNILTEKEIVRFLQLPDMGTFAGIRDRAILEVLYSSGIRASECANLTLYDINEEEGVLRIVLGKGQKDRIVAIGKTALRFVKLYLEEVRFRWVRPGEEQSALFLTEAGGKITRNVLAWIMRGLLKGSDFKKNITCHTLRHTCATHMMKHKANLRYIQKQLGHTCLTTTQRYLQVEISDLKAIHRRCHPREKMG